jgi:putative flippase GtrA
MKRRIVHFGFIGFIAFIFDALTYFIAGFVFLSLIGEGVPLMQKIAGFSAGILTTYLYNTKITFSVSYSWTRFWRYLSSQILGMLVNVCVFLVLCTFLPVFISMLGATLVAALVNFFGASRALRMRVK